MAHVRHDEGRGLRLESVVGSGCRTDEKRRKEMRRARCPSAVAAINRSDRAVALSPYVDTVSRPIFFLPLMSAAASIPKRTARDEWMSRVAMKRTEKKYDETIREKERENDREKRESGRETIRVLCESVSATCAMAVESVENESR